MAAERARDGCRIDLHVVHRLKDVSHKSDTGTAKVVQDMRDGTPLANLLVGFRVALQLADHDIGDRASIADGDAGEFRHGA